VRREEELIGDAELKMDWTEPPTALDAMGIDFFVLVRGEAQRDLPSGCRRVLMIS
jgi:hypothetical protein